VINVVPYTNRRLTIRNCDKVLNLFPNEDINLIKLKTGWDETKWAEKVARYFKNKGRNVSVEIENGTNFYSNDMFAEIGCDIIFIWKGVKSESFMGSFFIITEAISIHKRFPNINITIRYRYAANMRRPSTVNQMETSLEFLIQEHKKSNGKIKVELDLPHPWRGNVLKALLNNALLFLGERDAENIVKVKKCGNITIYPNTNIYSCQYQPQRRRKQFFGNADRDKYVIGTLRRGFFRDKQKCNYCGGGRYKFRR